MGQVFQRSCLRLSITRGRHGLRRPQTTLFHWPHGQGWPRPLTPLFMCSFTHPFTHLFTSLLCAPLYSCTLIYTVHTYPTPPCPFMSTCSPKLVPHILQMFPTHHLSLFSYVRPTCSMQLHPSLFLTQYCTLTQVSALCMNESSTILASGQTGNQAIVRIWQFSSATCLALFKTHDHSLYSLRLILVYFYNSCTFL